MKYELQTTIIINSNNNNWKEAKNEWKLKSIYQKPKGKCICGKYPITDHCIITNKINKKELIVGNKCVNNFLKIKTNNLFPGIKRIIQDKTKSCSKDLLSHALTSETINEWEYKFYNSIQRKRTLSNKQEHYKVLINEKMLRTYKR